MTLNDCTQALASLFRDNLVCARPLSWKGKAWKAHCVLALFGPAWVSGVKSESGGNPKQHLPKALVFLESSQPETQTIISRTKQELHCICKCLSMWQCKWEERGKFLQCSYSMVYFGNADNEVYMSSCLWGISEGGCEGHRGHLRWHYDCLLSFFNNNKKIFDLQSWA